MTTDAASDTAGAAVGAYLDHAATTPVDDRVLEAMLPYFGAAFGNPASVHRVGQRARRALEESRERTLAAVGGTDERVVFTSGATEANNQAIFGALALKEGGLIVGGTEHPSVLQAARRAQASGRDLVVLPPTAEGAVPLDSLAEALRRQAGRGGTALVALMYVNNETGVVTDPAPAAALARESGALFLCDAVQALGVEPLSLSEVGADMLSLSAHKVYGPKGAGALVLRRGLDLPPLLAGGEQERGLRPGTHNLPAIVGMGAAAELAAQEQPTERERLAGLQRTFEEAALALPGVRVNGAGARRSVKQSNLRLAGAQGETLLMLLDEAGVYVSAGSACAAGSLDPSHVLLAMGLSTEEAKASVRFSFGRLVDEAAVLRAVEALGAAVSVSRQVA